MKVRLKRTKEAYFYTNYSYEVLKRLVSGREVYYSNVAEMALTSFEEDSSEGSPEVLVEDSVDNRVQGGVHIA